MGATEGRLLRGLIYSMYRSEAALARALGWDKQKLNKITNGQKDPTVTELNDIAAGLGVKTSMLLDIFLEEKSPNEQQN